MSNGANREQTIRELQRKFDQAELHADGNTLQRVIADDFLSIGPKGFVLNKPEWIDRHQLFKYLQLEIADRDIRLYEKSAIVRNIQKNKSAYKDQTLDFAMRVMQVWVEIQGQWQLGGIQFSPLAQSD